MDSGLFIEDFCKRINNFSAESCRDAMSGLVDLLELSGEVAGGGRDAGDAEGGSVPDGGVIELGHGDVESVAELVLHGTDYLAAVFEGLRVGDFDLEG